jgi:hypothetical protein
MDPNRLTEKAQEALRHAQTAPARHHAAEGAQRLAVSRKGGSP